MKDFGYSSFRLAGSSPETKVVYTLFLMFAISGLFTTAILQLQRIGFGYERIVVYYLGGEINGQISFAKNFAVLLEQAHFHTFVVGITFLILSHLFIATSVRRGLKYFIILLSFFSSMSDMGGVWLVRYLSPYFAYFIMAAWIGMWVGYATMIFTSLYEMWLCHLPDSK